MLLLALELSLASLLAELPPLPVKVAQKAIQPQLAIDDSGGVHVVFLQGGNIMVSSSADKGQSFGAPVVAIDARGQASGGKQRGPRIGVDSKKVLFVTAPVTFDESERAQKYPTNELFLVTSADGGKSWTKPLQLNEVAKKAPESLHWLAVDPSGTAHVTWLDLRGRTTSGQDLYYSSVTNGVVSPNRKIAQTICECCAPGLSVDASGLPFVAWRDGVTEKPSREIYALRIDPSGAPTRARQLNGSPTNVPT